MLRVLSVFRKIRRAVLTLSMAGAFASARAEAPKGVSAEIDAAIARHNQTIAQAVTRADAERAKHIAGTLAELRSAATTARREGKESDAQTLEDVATSLAAPKNRRPSAFYTLDDFVGSWRWENNRVLRVRTDGTWRFDDTGETGSVELTATALKFRWGIDGVSLLMLPDRPPANNTYLVISHGSRYLVTKTGDAVSASAHDRQQHERSTVASLRKVASAREWLEAMDAGDYGAAWDAGSPVFHNANPDKADWVNQMRRTHASDSKVVSLAEVPPLYPASHQKPVPGARGETLFHVTRANGNVWGERIAWMRDATGKWGFLGHYSGTTNPDAPECHMITWFGFVNSGDYESAWAYASPRLRDSVTREAFIANLRRTRSPAGRWCGGWIVTEDAGDSLIMRWKSNYTALDSGEEYFRLRRESDGNWAVCEYAFTPLAAYAKPSTPSVKAPPLPDAGTTSTRAGMARFAQAWLGLLDAGCYSPACDHGSKAFLSANESAAVLNRMRAPLGRLTSRAPLDAPEFRAGAAPKPGEALDFRFLSTMADELYPQRETVRCSLDAAGRWRVESYSIEPADPAHPRYVAGAWLALADAGRWDDAEKSSHAGVMMGGERESPQAKWSEMLKRRGALLSRRLTHCTVSHINPPGKWPTVLRYESRFAGIPVATEVVTLRMAEDGNWRVSDYAVTSTTR